jgi:hypothetical protein
MRLSILFVLAGIGVAIECWQAALDQEWLSSCKGIEISYLDAHRIRLDDTKRDFSNAECA